MEGLVKQNVPDGVRRQSQLFEHPRVLVTGVEGYIGCVLSSRLLRLGYDVHGLDTGFYQDGWLFHDGAERPHTLYNDIRRVAVTDLQGFDAVVHLAELSNDPLCEFNEGSTYDVNFRGSATLAAKAKAAGVRRFIYASSCSVYGAAGHEARTETSEANPQTAYAHCKVKVERVLAELNDPGFETVCLRNATAFGASPRMRFDIVLNNLAGLAWTTKCIKLTSDGSPWRPLVHVQDICDAIHAVLEAPSDAVAGEVFNVGDDSQNYRVIDIVEAVAHAFPGCSVEVGKSNGDNRSYRVSFQKIRDHLPNFGCQWDAGSGAEELRRIFERVKMTEEIFCAPAFTRLNQLKRLLSTEQLDSDLYWRSYEISRDTIGRWKDVRTSVATSP
jgi:nucleoside-diphosphate-sugar epimerase